MAAVAVTVMTVGATALVTDQAWLVDQRDVLKTATDAAAVATTLELFRQLDLQPGISDADLAAILEPIARRYILLNLVHLEADRYARAEQSLVVQVTPNGIQRAVAESASEHRPCPGRTGDRGARTRGDRDVLDTRCPVGPTPAPALVEGRLGGDQPHLKPS